MAIVLSIVMVWQMLPQITPVYAAGTLATGVSGLSASYDNGTWSADGNTITGSVTTTSRTSCGSTTYTATTGTLTLKNEGTEQAILSYSASMQSGTGSMTDNAGGQITLGAGESATISITSNGDGDDTTVVVVSDIKLSSIQEVSVTFKPGDGGTFTVNGESVTAEKTVTQMSNTAFELAATPDSGKKLIGWFDEATGKCIASEASASLFITENKTIYPVFAASSLPIFDVAGQPFTNLNDAITYAVDNGQSKVVLVGNGTLAQGNYTIPSGITLLIPFDDAHTLYTDTPVITYNQYTKPSAYKVLTMAKNAKITVKNGGAISLGGKLSSKGQMGGYNGTPSGPDGRINMKAGSSITLESGANLYCWGYIYGAGSVVAQSGSTVYEAFQIKDWRGGSATLNISDYAFIFNQYYVQNIEVPLTVYAGAEEKLYSAVNASGSAYPIGATFIGSGGVFDIQNGYLVKDYIEAEDRLQVDVYGDVEMSSMNITGIPMMGSISTAEYTLPLNENISVNINSGTTTITQNISLLPGFELNVASGATAEINSNVYVYDSENWGNFSGTKKLYPVGYSVANETNAIRSDATLTDTTIDVNGTVIVNGGFYTSETGANIISSEGGGEIIFASGTSSDNVTLYEMADNKTKTGVTFTSAQLHNADGSYTQTGGMEAGSNFTYPSTETGFWNPITITFNANGGSGEMQPQNASYNTPFNLNANTFEAPVGKEFDKWNTEADGRGTDVANSQENIVLNYKNADGSYIDEYTLYAQWKTKQCKITFVDEDGTTVLFEQTVNYGEMPVYGGAEPTKAPEGTTTYEFDGWDKEIVAAVDDTIYKATYKANIIAFTITFKNFDGTVLQSSQVNAGETPIYTGQTPVKGSTVEFDYTFAGWLDADGNPVAALPEVTADAEYTANFTQTTRSYTVTFLDENGSEISSASYSYGTPASEITAPEAPSKGSTAQYEYTFAGWNPVIAAVTGNATYTATYSESVRNYTVTFLDEHGDTVSEREYPYGTPAGEIDVPQPPSKGDTAQYHYEFTGWSPEIADVTANAEYTAEFSEVLRSYLITFKNYDGSILSEQYYDYGTSASDIVLPDTPVRESTTQFNYTFIGWNPAVADVEGEAEYTAKFIPRTRYYTVTFYDEDGTTILYQHDYEYHDDPSKDAPNPTKPSTAQYAYIFTGWTDVEGRQVEVETTLREELTYYASYTALLRNYTVTFLNDDDTVLSSQSYPYGTPAENIIEPNPEKSGDTQYSYAFAGWDKEIVNVEGDATYKATYTQNTNSYTVTFKNYDGTLISENTYEYGTPAMNINIPERPERESTAQYEYSFHGWDKPIVDVTEDIVYTATFSETLRNYTITFLDEYGNTLSEREYPYGTQAGEIDIPPLSPKSDTEQYHYEFRGWAPEIANVEGDAVYTALYGEQLREYTVTFKNYDGSIISQVSYPYGTSAAEIERPLTPEKPATAQYSYQFDHWTPEIMEVTGDAEYTAQFNEVLRSYIITFVDENGAQIASDIYEYGTPVSQIAVPTPEKVGDAQYHYEFNGWIPALKAVEGEATYMASYRQVINTYTVTWDVNGQKTSETYEYGQIPEYKGETPARPSDEQYTYTFTGWDKAIVSVTGDATYTAQFSSTTKQYTITFVDEGGRVLQSSLLDYGVTPLYTGDIPVKDSTAQYNYNFTGWDKEIHPVNSDETYTAVFESVIRYYTITWKDDEGNVKDTTSVAYGEMPVHNPIEKAATAQYSYEFAGWTPELKAVDGDAEYSAVYTASVRQYDITWIIDGEVETVKYYYGDTPAHDTPIKAANEQYTYTFSSWSPEIASVTGEATYTAVFDRTINEYPVTWLAEDGVTVIKTINVPYGTAPVFDGETPVKDASAQYTYTFDGWTKTGGDVVYGTDEHPFDEVTGPVSYKAHFAKTLNSYTITFKNDNGDILVSSSYNYGDVPSYDTTGLTKTADAQYTYAFSGWKDEEENEYPAGADLKAVSGDATYTAMYSATTNQYMVRFVVDGEEKQAQLTDYGTVPVYEQNAPERAATAQYTYAFIGWQRDGDETIYDSELPLVTGTVVYTAVFESAINSYTIKFVDEDGVTVLDEQTLPYGQVPEYAGSMPVKTATDEFSYEFAGWNPAVGEVTGNATYTATYTSETNTYKVTWNNYDGSLLELDESVPYGTMPSYDGMPPEKDSSAQYDYEFNGWTPNISSVEGNVTYTAQFTEHVRSYDIKFVDEENIVLYQGTFEFGTVPTYLGETPTKDATAQYTYTFAGWTPAIKEVDGEAVYTAKFDAQLNSYTVTFKNESGEAVETDIAVPYGEHPEYNGNALTKAGDAVYDYSFAGWSIDGENVVDLASIAVEGDTVLTAVFAKEYHLYTILWVDGDGNIIDTQNMKYGADVIGPDDESGNLITPSKAATAQYSYEFNKWDIDLVDTEGQPIKVQGDMTITAKFNSIINKYEVKWVNANGDVLLKEDVDYGLLPTYTGQTPEKGSTAQYDYVFEKWTPDIETVTGDVTYTAVFKEVIRQYQVTWKNEDGTVLKTEMYNYGDTPDYGNESTAPAKESTEEFNYEFSGWSPAISAVNEDAEYTAVFNPVKRSYTVTFMNYEGSVLQTATLLYGENVLNGYTGGTPVRESSVDKVYTFNGWTNETGTPIPSNRTVTGDMNCIASFGEATRQYQVTFISYEKDEAGGDIILQQTMVDYGTIPSYDGELPHGYTWDHAITEVTGDAIYRMTEIIWGKWSLTVSLGGVEAENDTLFLLRDSAGNTVMQFVIKAGESSVNIHGLPVGTYSVVRSQWNWRYTAEAKAVEMLEANPDGSTVVQIVFGDAKTNEKWLNAVDADDRRYNH